MVPKRYPGSYVWILGVVGVFMTLKRYPGLEGVLFLLSVGGREGKAKKKKTRQKTERGEKRQKQN